MAEEEATDLAELLRDIDRPRALPAELRSRLQDALTAGLGGPRALTPELSDRLSRQILADADTSSPGSASVQPAARASYRLRWQRTVAGAAAACLLLAAGIGVALHSRSSSSPPAASAAESRLGARSSAGGSAGVAPGSALSPSRASPSGAPAGVGGTGAGTTNPAPAAAGSSGGAQSSSGSTGGSASAPASPTAQAGVNGAPRVQSVNPSEGPATGGTWVTVTGVHLGGGTAVRFGTTAAAKFVIVSDDQVKALSPAHLPGSVDVVVVTPQGTTAAGGGDVFRFTA